MAVLAVHFHELALKGGNRSNFQRTLGENLRHALSDLGRARVTPVAGRSLVEIDADVDAAMEKARRVSGVAYVLRVARMERDLEAVGKACAGEIERLKPRHFRISTKRTDKDFPMISTEVDRRVGAIVNRLTGVPVKLKGMDAEIHLAVLKKEILVGLDKRPGPGGLPVGTGGRVAVMMSGGIDSPVAAWRMINRGCRADLIHFHSHPLVDRTTQEKAKDIAEILHTRQYHTRLHLAPLAEIQKQVRVEAPEALRVVLYRRFMVRIAERIAKRRRCKALVTGESLGQVASQTLDNIGTVDAVATMPVLRPLIGLDKQEIVKTAQELGTFDISIQPDQDCCTLFVPPKPATRSRPQEAEEAEAGLDVEALVQDALDRTETVEL